ncbi:MAG: helix-turn-helix transcriptional regulator, partial [Ruthenibacterium sp.]
GSQLQKIKRHNVIAARMVQEIECNYADKNLSLYVLASLDDMNPVYLGRMFKKVQGCSVAEYINRVRLKRAAVLLLDSEATVIDIADTVGFANSNYFYSVFKKSLGVTPNVYRQCHGKI